MSSDAHASSILKLWKEYSRRYDGVKRTGNQALIEPYVLQKTLCGRPINFLVATGEGRDWYDQTAVFADLEMFTQLRLVRPGDVVFDLGANHGLYAVLLASMASPGGRVYAFDPFPLNADLIRFNALLNNAPIEVFEVGLSSAAGSATASSGSQIVAVDSPADSTPIRLDVLDRYAHLRPQFVKIDIEGAEVDCLMGATEVLRGRPNLHIEIHTTYLTHFGRTVDALFDLLPFDDYRCFIDYPGKGVRPYRREFPIEHHCALYLMRESPFRRIRLPADSPWRPNTPPAPPPPPVGIESSGGETAPLDQADVKSPPVAASGLAGVDSPPAG